MQRLRPVFLAKLLAGKKAYSCRVQYSRIISLKQS